MRRDRATTEGAPVRGQARAERAPSHPALRLQRLAGNRATARVLARDITPESIAAALDEIEVTKRETEVTGLKPWEIFEHAPRNTQAKKKLYNAYKKALRAERKAKTPLERAKAEERVASTRAALKKWIKGRVKDSPELQAEIDADPMEPGTFTRTRYSIEVDGTTVSLHDHVGAYASITPEGFQGSARRAGKGGPTVNELIDAQPGISASTKAILKLVSSFEGKFSSVNTWDIADVTWGFIQWTTGRSGRGSLIGTLLAAKRYAPDAFDRRLRRYGIDVRAESEGLVLTRPDGSVLTGKRAAKAMQFDPVLVAVLSAAGEDPGFKVAQLRHANDKVGQEVLATSIRVGKRTVRLGELLTSELGVGGAFNRAVHAGASRVKTLLTRAVKAHVKKEEIDPERPLSEWGAGAEAACIRALHGVEPDRMRKMAAGLSAEPGSFR